VETHRLLKVLCADWTVETESRCALALAPGAWDLAAGWVAGSGRWRDATSLARVGAALGCARLLAAAHVKRMRSSIDHTHISGFRFFARFFSF
jgi:hypothetical protein